MGLITAAEEIVLGEAVRAVLAVVVAVGVDLGNGIAARFPQIGKRLAGTVGW